MSKLNVELGLYGILLSSFIGVASFLFLVAEKLGVHLIWDGLANMIPFPIFYKAGIITIGAVLLFLLKKKWGNLPRASHELIKELKETQTVNYHHTFHSLLMSVVILSFGAGVGPEAPLLGAVTAFSIWQADKLRYLRHHHEKLKQLSWREKLLRAIHPFKYLQTYTKGESLTKIQIILFSLNGIAVFIVLMNMTEQPSFITKLGNSTWKWDDVYFFLPLLAYGYGVGVLYSFCVKGLKGFISQFSLPLFLKIFIGAVAIFIVSAFAPNLLFSGQHSMHLVVELGLRLPPLALLVFSIIKLLFLEICMETGWSGGDIFPISFASFLQGYALAQLFPSADSLFVVLVVSISMVAGVLQKEWIAVIFISLFFPMNLWPIAAVMLAILICLKKLTYKFFEKNQ